MLRLKGNRSVCRRLLHVLVQASLAGGHKTEGSTHRGNRIGTRGGGIVLCGHHDDSPGREGQYADVHDGPRSEGRSRCGGRRW
jgi:hypothetical protein